MKHPIYGELNYKKREPHTLERRIPKGRGMIKWAPFATMPQQFEHIKAQINNQNKVPRKALSEDRLEEINQTLHIALCKNQPIRIDYYLNGFIEHTNMTIEKIDQWAMMIIGTLTDTQETYFISFLDICNVEMI